MSSGSPRRQRAGGRRGDRRLSGRRSASASEGQRPVDEAMTARVAKLAARQRRDRGQLSHCHVISALQPNKPAEETSSSGTSALERRAELANDGFGSRAVKFRVYVFPTAPDSGHCQESISLFSEPSRIADHCVLGPSNSTELWPNNAARLSRIDWLWSAKRASVWVTDGSRRRVNQENPSMRAAGTTRSDGATPDRPLPRP